ncbi:unnamed protein product [Zymoseptoria tritici ST99CH_3D7]|uniref:Uncharacterized protein n=1 Tax=Zymoseptoria tritici (strain ST99CH_3D7) TaxID=1276538 RepID=A0A1X7RH35_ZYMT9|nr:unnamed protein product [Zymoseptoria tritici ST99CH_3D7]
MRHGVRQPPGRRLTTVQELNEGITAGWTRSVPVKNGRDVFVVEEPVDKTNACVVDDHHARATTSTRDECAIESDVGNRCSNWGCSCNKLQSDASEALSRVCRGASNCVPAKDRQHCWLAQRQGIIDVLYQDVALDGYLERGGSAFWLANILATV